MQGHLNFRSVSRYFQSLAPILALLAYLVAGDFWVFSILLLLPFSILLTDTKFGARIADPVQYDRVTGLLTHEGFDQALAVRLAEAAHDNKPTACLLLEVNAFAELRGRYGENTTDAMLKQAAHRVRGAIRDGDLVARLGEARIAICLAPMRRLDRESCLQLAARLQTALEEPVPLKIASILPAWTVGFCLSGAAEESPDAFVDRARLALEDAARNGASAIRVYTPELGRRATRLRKIEVDASKALDRDEIEAWFQPQISTDTGQVTGFEALARWNHPTHGLVPPMEFIPLLQKMGLSERLSERMLALSLKAMRSWDRKGLNIPLVGVNFAAEELRNPSLPDKVAWALDRFDILPNRLSIEILETVATGPGDEVIIRNVHRLAEMGCFIDLDDFGTGHTSIGAVRRLDASRIKIDRSFVTNVDQDADQQRMIAAIVTMCERLDLETLGEGVETAGEHAMLAQLGCGHVQGFGIARPMPFSETAAWVQTHRARLKAPPVIGRKTG